jgi:hypothetical protein
MIPVLELWMPVAVAAVLVFIVSSVLHMVLTYHYRDYRRLPNEAEALEVLGRGSLAPGLYFFPYAPSAKEMRSPEIQEKFRRGPVGMLVVRPSGAPAMGKHLAQWLGFCLLVSAIVACLAGCVLPAGASFPAVFRFAATAAFLAYGVGEILDSIWKGQPWGNTVRSMIDGAVYSLVTGGVFAWLWPR